MKLPSQSVLLRICLIGLPLGTILLGSASIFYTEFVRAQAPIEAPNPLARKAAATLSPVAKQDLITHVDTLARRIGERHAGKWEQLEAAKFYIESTLGINNLGYQVREQSYEVDGKTFANVAAELRGTNWPEELLIIGAHYDSAPNAPGADDNASGVAALLALAKNFAQHPQPRTLRFVAFTNEEPPYFQTPNMGSYRYAQSLKDGSDKVFAMISLESLGYYSDAAGSQKYPPQLADQYPTTGNFLAVIGNRRYSGLVDFAHQSASNAAVIPVEKGAFPPIVPGIAWSDHWSFWEFGHPAIMLTDTAIYRNPHYHRPSDKPDSIDFERLTAATQAAQRIILDLANTPAGTSFGN